MVLGIIGGVIAVWCLASVFLAIGEGVGVVNAKHTTRAYHMVRVMIVLGVLKWVIDSGVIAV